MKSNHEKDLEIQKKIMNSYINETMLLLQALLTLFLIIFGIMSCFEKELMPIFTSLFGILCFFMAYNNFKTYKRKNITIIYILAGVVALISVGVTLFG